MKPEHKQKIREKKERAVWVEGDIAFSRASLVLSGVTKILSVDPAEIRVCIGKNEMIFCGCALQILLFNENCLGICGKIRKIELCAGISVIKSRRERRGAVL